MRKDSQSLEYRDRGHMYFPRPKLIPFIKNLDDAVRTTASITEYKRLGKDLVEVHHIHTILILYMYLGYMFLSFKCNPVIYRIIMHV